jgi:hypothetical protein
MIAYIDTRPWILMAAVPILLCIGILIRRLWRPQSSYSSITLPLVLGFIALFQFLLYGPFVHQKRIVTSSATWALSEGSAPVVSFSFTGLPFNGLRTSDRDVIAHMRGINSPTIPVSVSITYDFGRMRGMDLSFAYADGILFRPE